MPKQNEIKDNIWEAVKENNCWEKSTEILFNNYLKKNKSVNTQQ